MDEALPNAGDLQWRDGAQPSNPGRQVRLALPIDAPNAPGARSASEEETPPHALGSPWRFALRRLARHKAQFALALFWSIIFVLVPLQLPVITGSMIDSFRGKHVRVYGVRLDPRQLRRNVQLAALALLALAAGRGLSAYLRQRCANKLTRRFVSETRQEMIERVTQMPLENHLKIGAGELLHRLVVDAQALRQFTNQVMLRTVTNVLRVVFPIVLLFMREWSLAAIVCSAIPVQWALNAILQKRGRRLRMQARRTRTLLTTLMKEQLDGAETLQGAGACEEAIRRTRCEVERLEREQLLQAECAAAKSAVIWGMTSLGLALTWGFGGLRVLDGRMTPGQLVAFAGLVAFTYAPFRRVAGAMGASEKVLTSITHVEELVGLPVSPGERPGARALDVREGRIELRDLSFSYAGHRVLRNASLMIQPRCLTAIAGASGCGKTTLLRLISRLYEPQEGEILIDGIDLRDCTLTSLRSEVALVPQRPMIFTGTIAENLRLAWPEATDGELLVACDAAGLYEFVLRQDKGLDTYLGRGGAQISGGEAQRLAVARALLKRPRILLLDEPTSALDMCCQDAILDTLTQLKGQMTIIVAVHRPEVLGRADRVVILEQGRLAETGPRPEWAPPPALYAPRMQMPNGHEKHLPCEVLQP